jgi:hypothetical protein
VVPYLLIKPGHLGPAVTTLTGMLAMAKDFPPTKPIDRHADERIKRSPVDADDRIKRCVSDASDERTVAHVAPIVDPRELGPLFVKGRRLLGEDETLYDDLLSRFTAAIAPRDDIESIWVIEFVDCIWDALFYRRVRAGFLRDAQKDAVKRLLQLDDSVMALWTVDNKASTAVIEETLEKFGYDWDTVRAQALLSRLDKIEQLDSLIDRADARRDKSLHNLERRRESGGRQRAQIIDGTRADRPPAR